MDFVIIGVVFVVSCVVFIIVCCLFGGLMLVGLVDEGLGIGTYAPSLLAVRFLFIFLC